MTATFIKQFWRWFITPPAPQSLWKRSAWALWLTPPLMGFPLLLPILEPSSIPGVLTDYWDIYLLFFAMPALLGAFCWWLANRAKRNA